MNSFYKVKLFHAVIMNPKHGRDELLKSLEEDAMLSFNGPRDDPYLGPLVDTYTGKEGFTKFFGREGEMWNDGQPMSFTVKEYHQQMSCNTAFVLSEMEGMTGEKEKEVLIRVAEVWNLSEQGKIKAVRLFATPYYEHSERLPPKIVYLASSLGKEAGASLGSKAGLELDPGLSDPTAPRTTAFGIHGNGTT